MKVLKITLYAILVLAILTLVVGIPSLGGRSIGIVGGWVWKSLWALLGVVGATLMLFLGGAYALTYFWRVARDPEDAPAQLN
jgi:uncharacterized membrane protein